MIDILHKYLKIQIRQIRSKLDIRIIVSIPKYIYFNQIVRRVLSAVQRNHLMK